MTTTLTRAASPPTVDLDTRLAIADASMTVRLEHAALAFEVNTAHLPAPVVEPSSVPLLPVTEPQPVSPLTAVYLAAIDVIRERGWTRGHLRDEQGAVCTVQAIRAAAGPANRGLADDACAALLDTIQQQYTADTIPSWNDSQTSADTVIRILGTAAQRA